MWRGAKKGEPVGVWWLPMTQAISRRRGQGEDSIYWDSSKNRYTGAVSLGFSPAGTRIRKKVTGRTKTEVRGQAAGAA